MLQWADDQVFSCYARGVNIIVHFPALSPDVVIHIRLHETNQKNGEEFRLRLEEQRMTRNDVLQCVERALMKVYDERKLSNAND